jgi:hypothetical protein
MSDERLFGFSSTDKIVTWLLKEWGIRIHYLFSNHMNEHTGAVIELSCKINLNETQQVKGKRTGAWLPITVLP